MRRLTEHDRDDRGVVTLLVILMIPILLLASVRGAVRFGSPQSLNQGVAENIEPPVGPAHCSAVGR